MKIIEAHITHLDLITPLFNDYRIFYKQVSDLEAAKVFLRERIENEESIIYFALKNDTAVGFTQLYPIFSSVSMKPMFILNDLYVAPENRGEGIGKALIDISKELCLKRHYKGLGLQTGFDNPAQHLYERLDFSKDSDLFYFWTNPDL